MTTDIRERVTEVLAGSERKFAGLEPNGYVLAVHAAMADALLEAFPQLAEEPEYEWSVGGVTDGNVWCDDEDDTYADREDAAEAVQDALDSGGFANAVLVRRRRAGSWEVVSDES